MALGGSGKDLKHELLVPLLRDLMRGRIRKRLEHVRVGYGRKEVKT